MKELEALNKMLGVVLAYHPPRKKKKKTKGSRKANAKTLQRGGI
jgi:hypothetical protein